VFASHLRRSLATNLGPLSERMCSGTPFQTIFSSPESIHLLRGSDLVHRLLFPSTLRPTKPEPSISQRVFLLVGTVALLTRSLTAASAESAVLGPRDSAPVQTAVFKGGTSSSGWIDFTSNANFGIYLPVKINGRSATRCCMADRQGLHSIAKTNEQFPTVCSQPAPENGLP
jgi:hypothetical protein